MSSPAQKAWYQRNRERLAAERQEIREAVLLRYGGKCFCCGEEATAFLTLDHENNDGAKDREARRLRGNSYYRMLLSLPSPLPGLRVACWNCNMALGLYGACPHLDTKEYLCSAAM